jgi:hypothetical protein
MENEISLSQEQITQIVAEVIELLLKKNEDYGSASFDLGLNGNMVHIWDKAKRYKTLVEKHFLQTGVSPNFESIRDTLKDIIGYAIIGIVILDHENKTDPIK